MATMFPNVPEYLERKGSLFLRSDQMNYSRATLNSNWHQAREAEPRDYDMSKGEKRDLCLATYNRIGNVTKGEIPETTYQYMASQLNLKPDWTERDASKPMVALETIPHIDLDRDTGKPKRGYGAVLPRHHPEYNRAHLESTHRADYTPPYPFTPAEEKPKDFPDESTALKKCHSQFTDTADYRRPGRNTFQDESGLYANSHLKKQTSFVNQENPITAAFR